MTGFLTCLLAVVRTIHLVFPLHVINWTAVKVATVVYSVVIVACEIVSNNFLTPSTVLRRIVHFPAVASVFITVVLVNVISLVKLYFSQSSHSETRDIKRKATITVAIVSAIYCLCNIGFIVFIAGITTYPTSPPVTLPIEVIDVLYFILPPLNSACNPVIYLIRKEDMRLYVKTLWSRIAGCLCGRKRENRAVSGVRTDITLETGAGS